MRQLLAGHDTIEFGWIICSWIPAIRKYAQNFDEVIIVCRTGHEYLYRDFATKFEYFDKEGRTGLYPWTFRDKPIKMPKKFIKKYPNAEVVVPCKKVLYKWPRKYIEYGKCVEESKYDLVIHARSEVKFDRKDRNWPVRKYIKLLKELRNGKHFSVCSIGSKKGAGFVPGTEDKRGIPLEELCNILYSSTVCIGPSSGPLHLASLCKCKHVVWTDDKYQKAIKETNRYRYEELWNPFKADVKVIDKYGWNPLVETVVKAVRYYL